MAGYEGTRPVVVGLVPDQDPAVLRHALDLAARTQVPLIGGYVDPGSYLIEWDPSGNPLGQSLHRALDPEDEAAADVRELEPLLAAAARESGVSYSFRVLGGDPALALGRLARAVHASVIVVGARKPGLTASVNEALTGSVVRKLLATQHVPVLAIPRSNAHAPLHG